MKRFTSFLLLVFVLVFCGQAWGENIYIAQTAQGGDTGADCANAHSAAWFNTAGNWGTDAGDITPGDTVNLCDNGGAFTTILSTQLAGSSGSEITITVPVGETVTTTELNVNHNYIILDGGSRLTATSTSTGWNNGVIDIAGSYSTVKNLTVSNSYRTGVSFYVSGETTATPSYSTLENVIINGAGHQGVMLCGTYNTVKGCTIRQIVDTIGGQNYGDANGISVFGGYHTIKGNHVYDWAAPVGSPHLDCVQTFDKGGAGSGYDADNNSTYEYNRFEDYVASMAAFMLSGTDSLTIRYNVIESVMGINAQGNGDNNTNLYIYGNLFNGGNKATAFAWDMTNVASYDIRNNATIDCLYHSYFSGANVPNGTTRIFDYHAFWNTDASTPAATHNLSTGNRVWMQDYEFTAFVAGTTVSGNDYTLTSISPLIDAGYTIGGTNDQGLSPSATIPASTPTVVDQDSYSAWDVGPYVYTAETPTPPPPPTPNIYYVKSGGSDAAAGTADGTAWAHCPGMQGWTGTAVLIPGDTVYFRSQDTWTGTGSVNYFLILSPGVKYYGNVYGSGTRAKFTASGLYVFAIVFDREDHTSESTIFEGVEIDGGSLNHHGIAFITPYGTQNMTGAVKRIKNCVVHDTKGTTTGHWESGIIAQAISGYTLSNLEIIGNTVYNTGEEGIVVSRYSSGNITNALVKGNTVYSTGVDRAASSSGIKLEEDVDSVTVEDNVCYTNTTGILVSGSETGVQSGIVVRYNKLYGNTNGIRLAGTCAKSALIYGNILYGQTGYGILLDSDLTNASNSISLFNNSLYGNGSTGQVFVNASSVCTTLSIKNNAFHCIDAIAISDTGSKITANNNNLYYRSSGNVVTSGGSSYTSATVVAGYEATAQVTDPLFTTPASGNFILGVGSPAIDAGADLGTYNLLGSATSWPSSIVLVDADSNTWDIGAYTYTASGGETDAPVITVVSGTDAGPTKTDTINLTIADASAITISKYGYSTDNTCNASDTYSTTYTTGVNFAIIGNHTDYLCAMAQDVYGNTGYQLVGQLNTDNTSPVVNITSPTSGTVDGTGVITFTDNDTTDPECALDSGAYTNCTSASTVINTLTGWGDIAAGAAFTLRLRDTDTAGNVGSTSVSLTRSGGSAGDIAACGTISTSGGSHLVSGNLTNAGGTCLIISGSNNSIDLGGYKITAGTSAAGVGIAITGSNNKVYNGSIAVGGGSQVNVAGVHLSGTGNEIYYLDIETSGGAISGEQYVNSVNISNAPNKVHHVWGKVSGTTTNISYAPDNIWYTARNSGGAEIHDCVLVGGHRGINADYVGRNLTNPATSRIYNNYVSTVRTGGTKQPNGIGVTESLNFEVYNNQIISDDGRGFITSNYGQGNPAPTSGVNFYNNRVDVGYTIPAGGGAYLENHAAGVYVRYGAKDNNYHDNIIIIDSNVPADAYGRATENIYCGSDSTEALQTNNKFYNNVLINHDDVGTGQTTGISDLSNVRVAVNITMYITDNQYYSNQSNVPLWTGNWDYYYIDGIGTPRVPLPAPTVSGNTVITPISYTPSAPTGLALRKFSTDCYLLTWNDNRTTYPAETQTYEYFIYKDDVKVSGITSRGGTFYVDLDEGDATDYKITAVNLYGTEGAACDNVNTSTATAGWTGVATDTTPPLISSLLPTGTLVCPADPYYQDISWSTNEAATCKFSTSDISYDIMENFAQVTGGVTHHSSQVYTTCGRAYTYYVRCIDETGNRNTSSYTIAFTLSDLDIDVTAPACAITTPADDPHASVAATVTIEGTASDAVGVTSVTWVNDQGGSGTATGTTSWSFTAALTTSGNNTFTVSANDAAGNAGTDTVVVTYDVPPTIVIASPASGTYTASDFTITISGVCDDDSAVTAVSWANDLGGSDTCTTDGTTFSCVVQLFRGVNTVTVTAADDDTPANESTDELVVTYLTSIFYINDGTGDDGYSGTSPDNPWETVDQLNASTFDPGDQILLRRGRTFTGKIVMPSSGSSGSPIILGAYGTGEDPVLDCSGETNCIDADSQTYVTIGNIHMINSTGARITGYDATWTIAANSYYLDATSGSNSNVGSESLPYETVAYVESLVWMIPGDIVYLKKGETFTGPLIIPASGDSDKYIYVKAYGSGDRPVIQ